MLSTNGRTAERTLRYMTPECFSTSTTTPEVSRSSCRRPARTQRRRSKTLDTAQKRGYVPLFHWSSPCCCRRWCRVTVPHVWTALTARFLFSNQCNEEETPHPSVHLHRRRRGGPTTPDLVRLFVAVAFSGNPREARDWLRARIRQGKVRRRTGTPRHTKEKQPTSTHVAPMFCRLR